MIRASVLVLICLSAFAQSQKTINTDNITKLNEMGVVIAVNAARDIGPVTRMDGSGLILSIDIYSLDRQQLPEIIDIVEATAFFDDETWNMSSSRDISIARYFDGTGFSFKFREGPLWPIGAQLNISFTLLINESRYLYSQQKVPIMKNP